MRVLKDQGLAHAQRLAVYLERFLALLVLDPEIIADSHHLLPHLVAVPPAARSPELAVVLALIAPFASSSW